MNIILNIKKFVTTKNYWSLMFCYTLLSLISLFLVIISFNTFFLGNVLCVFILLFNLISRPLCYDFCLDIRNNIEISEKKERNKDRTKFILNYANKLSKTLIFYVGIFIFVLTILIIFENNFWMFSEKYGFNNIVLEILNNSYNLVSTNKLPIISFLLIILGLPFYIKEKSKYGLCYIIIYDCPNISSDEAFKRSEKLLKEKGKNLIIFKLSFGLFYIFSLLFSVIHFIGIIISIFLYNMFFMLRIIIEIEYYYKLQEQFSE